MDNNNFEPEIDFKSLPKSPSRLFGWIFPYYVVLFLIVGIYFVKHMDYASFNKVPAIYTDSLIINVDVPVKKGGIMPAVDLGIISNPTDELVKNGKTLFKTNCASCHGDEGKGDGLAAAALNPAPRNFHSSEGWTNGRKFNNLFKTLQTGVPGTGMIAYEYLPIEDRIAIIQYIRTLADFPSVSDVEISELDKTYNLSKGVNSPSNISIEMAETKISEEADVYVTDVEKILNNINSFPNKEVVDLFNSVANDKQKVIAVYKRDFLQTKDAKNFISRIINFPTESGFKSTASLLTKDKLTTLFELLNKTIS